jgi:hypothetical protein
VSQIKHGRGGATAPTRNDEPTRVAPYTREGLRQSAEIPIRPSVRYHLQHPAHDTTEIPPLPSVPPPPRAVSDADVHYETAEALLARGDARRAVLEAQKAIKLRPPSPAEQALYAWLLYQRAGAGPRVHPHVWHHLDEALHKDPDCAVAHYYKGMLCKRTGHAADAAVHFTRALQLAPSNLEAERELRAIERHRRKR